MWVHFYIFSCHFMADTNFRFVAVVSECETVVNNVL